MNAEGVKLLGYITGAFGLIESISSLNILRKNLKKIKYALNDINPDIVVLIDFPEFNLKVANIAKKFGIKVLYYVGPQIWAWRKKRIYKIKKLCDKVALILPFEIELYKKAGIEAEFVGHPIVEEIKNLNQHKKDIQNFFKLDPTKRVIALLPGSRKSEIKRLLPLFINVVCRLKEKYNDIQYILPLALNINFADFQKYLLQLKKYNVNITHGMATETLLVSDLAIVASGTATLQAALTITPMVVVYKLFPLSYIIGKMVINVKFISLVNILLQKEVVKELLQWKATPNAVITEIEEIFNNYNFRKYMIESFMDIKKIYQQYDASTRVAQIVGEIAQW